MTTEPNVYAPPLAAIEEVQAAAGSQPYFVVSPRKFAVLNMATGGLYSVYCFYRNWRQQKCLHQLDVWPAPRAVFALFFTHSLLRRVDRDLRGSGIRHVWSPDQIASLYVLANLASFVPERAFPGSISAGGGLLLLIAAVGILTASLVQAQRAINLVSGDPDGTSNQRLQAANYFWLLVGALFWLANIAEALHFAT